MTAPFAELLERAYCYAQFVAGAAPEFNSGSAAERAKVRETAIDDSERLRTLATAMREAEPELDAGDGLDGYFIRLPKEAP